MREWGLGFGGIAVLWVSEYGGWFGLCLPIVIGREAMIFFLPNIGESITFL
jgi:hypothetical protein